MCDVTSTTVGGNTQPLWQPTTAGDVIVTATITALVTLQSSNLNIFCIHWMYFTDACLMILSHGFFSTYLPFYCCTLICKAKRNMFFGFVCLLDNFYHQVCRRYDQQINWLSKWLLVAALKTTSVHKLRAKSTFSRAVADCFGLGLGASSISSFPVISSMSLGQLIITLGEKR